MAGCRLEIGSLRCRSAELASAGKTIDPAEREGLRRGGIESQVAMDRENEWNHGHLPSNLLASRDAAEVVGPDRSDGAKHRRCGSGDASRYDGGATHRSGECQAPSLLAL